MVSLVWAGVLGVCQTPGEHDGSDRREVHFDFRYGARGAGGGMYTGFYVTKGKEIAPIQCAILSTLSAEHIGLVDFKPDPLRLLEERKTYVTDRVLKDELIQSYNAQVNPPMRLPKGNKGPVYSTVYEFLSPEHVIKEFIDKW
jgi:hypothetical protein